MNLYLVTARIDAGPGYEEMSEFVGSQAEAASVRARHVKEGTPRKNITTTSVNVPTDKEGLGLTWDRVSIERRMVWVEGEDMKADHAIGVPLSDRAVEVLKAELGKNKTWVFTYRGKPISEIKTAFQAACVRAGVGEIVDGKYRGFTWHGLRHTWATWHVQSGTPLDVLEKLGAWNDERMVKNYAHHSPGYLAQFANNVRKK